MSTPSHIVGHQNGIRARVTEFGQLVVAPLDYSEPVAITLDTVGTAFNFITPAAGQKVVITDIIVSADKGVSNTTPANIEIYEADEASLTTASKAIVSPQLTGASNVSYIGLNMLVGEGKWVNAKTDDNNVLITIMFYRVPKED